MASDAAADADQVRRPRGGDQPVSFAELFFDLVYVVGVTQLSARLTGDLTWGGAFECLVLLLALWWAWVSTAWFTNAFDPDQRPVRAVLIAVMLASLVMTAAVPEAFGDRGTWFAGAYVAIQVGRTLYGVAALHRRHDPDDDTLRRDQERVLVWAVLAAVPWLVGGLVSGPARMALWLLALAIDYAAPAAGFRVPGLGRSATTDWEIEGQHLAERCQLFLIVAFGESILATGATFADEEPTAMTVASLAVAFGGNVALWWIYFDRAAEQAADTMARHHDPGRLGRAAYVYLHLPMVAGVLVTAVGDKLAVSNPTGTTAAATAATVLGGPAVRGRPCPIQVGAVRPRVDAAAAGRGGARRAGARGRRRDAAHAVAAGHPPPGGRRSLGRRLSPDSGPAAGAREGRVAGAHQSSRCTSG
jgi:low temperature requirement protein LtrA